MNRRKRTLLIFGLALLFLAAVTLSGMLMLVGLLQLLNTSFPMDVTLSGMLILVSLWQS